MAVFLRLVMLSLAVACGCDGVIGGAGGPRGSDPLTGPGPGAGVGVTGAQLMHRLNRTEYQNTVRDLLGTQLAPAASFPADDVSLGFDNIAQVLTISPLQFELYEQAAQELAKEALSTAIRDTIVFCDPNDPSCLNEILRELARRAWRRPVTDEEVARLQGLVDVALDEGDELEQGLELAIRGVLLS
ncbi:MAG: DUF1587 domain-containing protein, partial [Polyangiales bacterium]